MPKRSEFVEYLLEMMSGLGEVRSRAMFGGYGIYMSDLMIGLVADDVLYIKVDDENRADFEAEGSGPFMYNKNGTMMAMSYYELPEAALDNREEMQRWAESGYAAALRNPTKKRKKKK